MNLYIKASKYFILNTFFTWNSRKKNDWLRLTELSKLMTETQTVFTHNFRPKYMKVTTTVTTDSQFVSYVRNLSGQTSKIEQTMLSLYEMHIMCACVCVSVKFSPESVGVGISSTARHKWPLWISIHFEEVKSIRLITGRQATGDNFSVLTIFVKFLFCASCLLLFTIRGWALSNPTSFH